MVHERIPALLAAAVFVLSCALWGVYRQPGRRYVFLFCSADSGRLVQENRWLTSDTSADSSADVSAASECAAYVDELLLGPCVERCRPLFSPGTRALSCFVREGTLYVELSDELMSESGDAVAIRDGVELFTKNVRRNFPRIKQVELFADGKKMFDGV